MKASLNCIKLIKDSEGFSAVPYLCPAGIPTIGYGSTRYEDGRRVTLHDIAISEGDAIRLCMATLATEYENAVNRYVKVPLNQNQADALIDFAYNCGIQNLRTSTLLKKLNAGDYAGAADQFGKWVQSNGRKLAGLVKRREAERLLFIS